MKKSFKINSHFGGVLEGGLTVDAKHYILCLGMLHLYALSRRNQG
ncbi:hypothetical protein CLV87_1406 [Pelagimonas phthalicica]|nr:hypothetical protein CLV87_1406 [Pelagimonas phthalicica]